MQAGTMIGTVYHDLGFLPACFRFGVFSRYFCWSARLQ
jgi:hypothetical protein